MRSPIFILFLAPILAHGAEAQAPCSLEPWESFIQEAATRFEIPAIWIRAILRSESAGCERLNHAPTTSNAGAMGLMQLLPETWNTYRERLSLPDNAYDPKSNILAGAAYLRDLYARYGWPGAAAAYQAGPDRYEASLTHAKPLPAATLDYLARVERAMTEKPRSVAEIYSPEPPPSALLFVELRQRKAAPERKDSDSPAVQIRETERAWEGRTP